MVSRIRERCARTCRRFRSAEQLASAARRDTEVMAEISANHQKEAMSALERFGPARKEYERSFKRLRSVTRELAGLNVRLAHDIEKNAALAVRISHLPRVDNVPLKEIKEIAASNRAQLAQTRASVRAAQRGAFLI